MTAVVADTHATIWYLLNAPELSALARQVMEQAAQDGEPIYVPSITLVEIVYLVEKARIPPDMLTRLVAALEDDGNVLTLAPLDLDVVRTLPKVPRDLVPDMPDRIIAATALSRNLPIITRDHKIQLSGLQTLW